MAEMVKREHYIHNYGFANLDDPHTNPLALVSVLPNDDVHTDSLLEGRINQYLAFEVYKYTGMAMDAFFAQPRYIVNGVIDRLERRQAAEHKVATDTLNQQRKLEDAATQQRGPSFPPTGYES